MRPWRQYRAQHRRACDVRILVSRQPDPLALRAANHLKHCVNLRPVLAPSRFEVRDMNSRARVFAYLYHLRYSVFEVIAFASDVRDEDAIELGDRAGQINQLSGVYETARRVDEAGR